MQTEIIYQDRELAVVVKPSGVVSESPGMPELLREQCGGSFFCVHRLDTGVGGVMVYARTRQSAAKLSSAVTQRAVEKDYLAVVQGRPEQDRGVLKDLLFHDKGKNKTFVVRRMRNGVKEAELTYRLLDSAQGKQGEISLLRVRLLTGRSHQIRVQLAFRGMPLLGDRKYGSKYKGCGIALWAEGLRFPHPHQNREMEFHHLPPEQFPWTAFSLHNI